jgi:hypothetical protein
MTGSNQNQLGTFGAVSAKQAIDITLITGHHH